MVASGACCSKMAIWAPSSLVTNERDTRPAGHTPSNHARVPTHDDQHRATLLSTYLHLIHLELHPLRTPCCPHIPDDCRMGGPLCSAQPTQATWTWSACCWPRAPTRIQATRWVGPAVALIISWLVTCVLRPTSSSCAFSCNRHLQHCSNCQLPCPFSDEARARPLKPS